MQVNNSLFINFLHQTLLLHSNRNCNMNRWNGYYNMHTHRAYTYVQRNNAKLVHFGLRMMSQEVFFFSQGQCIHSALLYFHKRFHYFYSNTNFNFLCALNIFTWILMTSFHKLTAISISIVIHQNIIAVTWKVLGYNYRIGWIHIPRWEAGSIIWCWIGGTKQHLWLVQQFRSTVSKYSFIYTEHQ